MSNKKPLVRVEGLYKRFNAATINETDVFTDFSLMVNEGDFISVVGSNGSGKTTLLSLICGSLTPDGGKIFLRDKEITKLPEYKRGSKIGRVFQNPAMGTCPSLTILENMSLAENKNRPFGLRRGVNKRRIDFYKSQLELLRMGMEDKINLQAGVLSGGQRQALALLISAMTPIDLLVLDEHTAALDPNSSENIMEMTEKIVRQKGITTIMVTHNLRFAAEYGSRLIMMHGGKSIIDSDGDEKAKLQVSDILGTFNEISIECGN